jgi:phage baseplate assembly protein W
MANPDVIVGLAPVAPLRIGARNQFLMVQDYKALVKQNFKNLLLTAPGERVMDSNFGVGLRNYLFKQNTSLTHGEINTRIYEQVQKYLPYIEVLDVVFNSSEDEYDASQLGIKVYFEVVPLGVQDLISIDAAKTASSF